MEIVPLAPTPSQTVSVVLEGQFVTLNVYQQAPGLWGYDSPAPPALYMDVIVAGAFIVAGVLCLNLNRIVRDLYLGLLGDFVWIDNTGAGADPIYSGIGSQFSLAYLSPIDLPSGVG